jgi:hypothetical protein
VSGEVPIARAKTAMENEATTPDRETQQEETPLTHAHEAGETH